MDTVPRWLLDLVRLLRLSTAETISLLQQWQNFKDPPPFANRKQLEDFLTIARDEEMCAWLLRMGLIGERELMLAKARANCVAFVDLQKVSLDPDALRLVPGNFAAQTCSIPIKKDGTTLFHAFPYLPSEDLLLRVRDITDCKVVPVLAVRNHIEESIRRCYPE